MNASRIALATAIWSLVFTAAQAQADWHLATSNTGWYDSNGIHSPENTNYITGGFGGLEYRNFAIFDLTGMLGEVTGGRLRYYESSFVTPDELETLNIYDVTTDLTQLTNGFAGITAFDDLGTGVLLGTQDKFVADPSDYVEVPLNAAAVALLNAANGPIAFGGSLATLADIDINNQFLFGDSQGIGVELLLDGAQPPAAAPASLTYDSELHPVASHVRIEVFLGDPDEGGTLVTVLANQPLHGTVEATTALNNHDSGTIQFDGASLAMDDALDVLVDLDALGTVRTDLQGIGFDINSSVMPAFNTAFSLDEADAFTLSINAGTMTIRDPAGIVEDLLGDAFPIVFDFNVDPLELSLSSLLGRGAGGRVDAGPGLFTELREINLALLDVPVEIGNVGDIPVFVRLSANVHVAIPEPSSLVLGLLGAVGVGLVERRRRKV